MVATRASVGAAILAEFRQDPSTTKAKNHLAVAERLSVSESSVRKASQAYRRGDVRRCETCKQEFLPLHGDRNAHCSTSCGRSRGKPRKANCEICGKEYVPVDQRGYPGKPRSLTRTCSLRCGNWLNHPGAIGSTCVVPWSKCPDCGELAIRQCRRPQCERTRLLRRLAVLLRRELKTRPRHCDYCGDPVAIGRIRTYCAKPECVRDYRHVRKHSRRLKTGRIKAESSSETSLRSIAERDGWRCHICKRAVRRKLGGQDRLAPSLDHLVPVSDPRANRSYHSPEYLALAHKGCNSSLRDRGEFQLYLVSPPSREP